MRDLHSNIDIVSTIVPEAYNATVTGSGVDMADLKGAEIVFVPGVITDGVHTPSVEESSDNIAFTAVAAADLLGTTAAIASNVVQRVGYRGSKRYIRTVVTVAGATVGGVYAAAIVRGFPASMPTA